MFKALLVVFLRILVFCVFITRKLVWGRKTSNELLIPITIDQNMMILHNHVAISQNYFPLGVLKMASKCLQSRFKNNVPRTHTKPAAIRIDTVLAIQNRQNGRINNQIM